MPGRNPFLIVKEYVQPGEMPQVRKNALTALAALGDADSRALLAEVALSDADPDVREKAEVEIASMPSESARAAVKLLLDELRVPEQRRGAYALLGKLRNRGLSFEFPHLPITARMRLAKSMRDHLYPKRSVKFNFRTFWGISAGVFLSWLVVTVYCYATLGVGLDGWSVAGYLIFGWMLTTGISAASTLFTSPARLYADWKGGVLLDVVMTTLSSLIVSAVAVLLSRETEAKYAGFHYQHLLLFSTPLTAAAIRIGTLAVFGWAKSRQLNWLIQMVVGGSCGLATYDLMLITTGNVGDGFLARTWAMVVLCSYGLAGAFAWVDTRSALIPVSSLFGKAVALSLTLVTFLFSLMFLIPLPSSEKNDLGVIVAPGTQQIDLKDVPLTGATVTFQTASDSWLSTRFLGEESEQIFAVQLLRSREHQIVEEMTPSSEVKLSRGVQYEIHIRRKRDESVNIFDKFPQVASRLSWAELEARLLRRYPSKLPTLVSVNLSFDSTFSISVSPASQSISSGQVARYTVTLAAENTYKGVVAVQCVLPYGMSDTTCMGDHSSLSVTGPTSMLVTVRSSAFQGTYSLSFSGTAPFMNTSLKVAPQQFRTTVSLTVK